MLFRKIILTILLILFINIQKADAIKIGLETQAKEVKVASSVSGEIYDIIL